APTTEATRPEPQVVEDEIPPTGNDQVLGMLSAIEQQLRQLGDVQRQHEDQLTSLIDRSAPPAAAGSEPADAEAQKKQPSFVVEMDDQEQTPKRAEDRQGLEDMASELETSRQQTDQMRQQLEDAQTRIQEIAEESDGGGDVQDRTGELAEAHEKIEALQSRVIELEAVAAVGGDDDEGSDEKDEQIAALTEQVAQMQEALDSRDEEQEQPVPAPPPDSAGAEMIERQRKQIERLTEQLTAVNAGGGSGDIQQRDARIAELEEELEELSQGGKQGVSKLVAGRSAARRAPATRRRSPSSRSGSPSSRSSAGSCGKRPSGGEPAAVPATIRRRSSRCGPAWRSSRRIRPRRGVSFAARWRRSSARSGTSSSRNRTR
ncbi:MAG: hypothetical protein ACYTA3_11815, partial [Planctomycetota bacterium]